MLVLCEEDDNVVAVIAVSAAALLSSCPPAAGATEVAEDSLTVTTAATLFAAFRSASAYDFATVGFGEGAVARSLVALPASAVAAGERLLSRPALAVTSAAGQANIVDVVGVADALLSLSDVDDVVGLVPEELGSLPITISVPPGVYEMEAVFLRKEAALARGSKKTWWCGAADPGLSSVLPGERSGVRRGLVDALSPKLSHTT